MGFGLLERHPKGMSVLDTAFYTATIVQALRHLHKLQVLHRSLKSECVLIDSQGYSKLGDITFAKQLKADQPKTFTMCGTPDYMSPEQLGGEGYGLPTDWWAMGVLVYEMLVCET